MNKIVDEIMKESLHLYKIKLNLTSGIAIEIDCCKCFFAYDHETAELEIHEDNEKEREYLDNPIFSIKEKYIKAWDGMDMKVNKQWFDMLKRYINIGMFSHANVYVQSMLILLNKYDEIMNIPTSLDEREWELYFAYLKEKLTND